MRACGCVSKAWIAEVRARASMKRPNERAPNRRVVAHRRRRGMVVARRRAETGPCVPHGFLTSTGWGAVVTAHAAAVRRGAAATHRRRRTPRARSRGDGFLSCAAPPARGALPKRSPFRPPRPPDHLPSLPAQQRARPPWCVTEMACGRSRTTARAGAGGRACVRVAERARTRACASTPPRSPKRSRRLSLTRRATAAVVTRERTARMRHRRWRWRARRDQGEPPFKPIAHDHRRNCSCAAVGGSSVRRKKMRLCVGV